MQLSGSFLQSVLHLNLSQVSHPIGGVRANPLSNVAESWMRIRKARDNICHMHMLISEMGDGIALIIAVHVRCYDVKPVTWPM